MSKHDATIVLMTFGAGNAIGVILAGSWATFCVQIRCKRSANIDGCIPSTLGCIPF